MRWRGEINDRRGETPYCKRETADTEQTKGCYRLYVVTIRKQAKFAVVQNNFLKLYFQTRKELYSEAIKVAEYNGDNSKVRECTMRYSHAKEDEI